MFQAWRRKVRAAEAAYRRGELEQARQILDADDLTQFLPGKQLAGQVRAGMLQQAQTLAAHGHSSAGWRSLELAASLEGAAEQAERVRQQLVALGTAEVERYLVADEPREALRRLEKLERRDQLTAATRTLRQVAHLTLAAGQLRRQGKFAEAEACFERAAALRPDWGWFSERRAQCRLKLRESRQLSDALYHALAREDWPVALAAAEGLLALAPDNAPARQARRQAWAAVGLHATLASDARRPYQGKPPRAARRSTHLNLQAAQEETVTRREPGPRLLLWIDAVGGYLVCLGDEIALGPPGTSAGSEVPLLADLSRRHAVLRRDGEGWWIEPRKTVRLDGQPLTGPAALRDGQLLQLGESVELRFRQPHPLSASARLEFVSRHKTEPAADGVLLMADSLILGPSAQNHVVCRDWRQELVLFRQGEQLFCRSAGPLEVDGQPQAGKTPIRYNTQLAGPDFSLCLEAVNQELSD